MQRAYLFTCALLKIILPIYKLVHPDYFNDSVQEFSWDERDSFFHIGQLAVRSRDEIISEEAGRLIAFMMNNPDKFA